MARAYKVSIEQILVAAAQDLLQISGAAGKMLRVLAVRWSCTDTTLATAQQLATRCRVLPATVTNGAGGGTPNVSRMDPGDAAASFTALANNTGKATTSGTPQVVLESGDYLNAGLDHPFPKPPPVGPTSAFVFELLSVPSGTVHLSAEALVEEIG
jgi:hypothetical protein